MKPIAYPSSHSIFSFAFKDWLIGLFLVASPFFMFAIVADRDWPTLWVMLFAGFFLVIEFLRTGGHFWIDRSYGYLGWFLAAYVLSMLIVLFSPYTMSLLGRTPPERAITITLRIFFAAFVYVVFVNCLADGSERSFHRIFVIEMMVGLFVAFFGILQYVSFVGFGYDGLTHIEPTNETYKLYSSFLGKGSQRVYRAAAFFNEPSVFGFFLVPFFVKAIVARSQQIILGTKTIHAVIIGVFLLAILVNMSLTAVLSVFIITVLFLLYSLRNSPYFGRILLLSMGILVLIVVSPVGSIIVERLDRVLGLQDPSTLDRIFRAFTGVRVFLESPFYGVGPGGYAFWYPRYGGFLVEGMAAPLNMWLYFLTDVGILGFIPFLMFLGSILRRGYRAWARHRLVPVYFWSLISFLVLHSTIDMWYIEIFWFELAMLTTLASAPNLSSVVVDSRVRP